MTDWLAVTKANGMHIFAMHEAQTPPPTTRPRESDQQRTPGGEDGSQPSETLVCGKSLVEIDQLKVLPELGASLSENSERPSIRGFYK